MLSSDSTRCCDAGAGDKCILTTVLHVQEVDKAASIKRLSSEAV